MKLPSNVSAQQVSMKFSVRTMVPIHACKLMLRTAFIAKPATLRIPPKILIGKHLRVVVAPTIPICNSVEIGLS